MMETLQGDSSDLWESAWDTTEAEKDQAWKVYYFIIARGGSTVVRNLPIQDT